MANELSITSRFSFSKGGAKLADQLTFNVTVAGDDYSRHTLSVPITDTTVEKGSITTVGFVFVKNLDATNFCTFGTDGINFPVKLLPGEMAGFRIDATNLHAKANIGATLIEFTLFEL